MREEKEIKEEIRRMEDKVGMPSEFDQPHVKFKFGWWAALKWVMSDETE